MKKIVVIVAGGAGTRMESNIPKQFLLLNNKPVIWHSVKVFANAFNDIRLIIVLPESYIEEGKKILTDFSTTHSIDFVTGGPTRFHSVKNGLALIKEKAVVFVHDAVRCLITEDLIHRCYQQAVSKTNAIPAIAASDSIRLTEANGKNILLDRRNVRLIQTPQTFQSDLLLPAFEQDHQECFTDEASVVESSGKEIFLIEGESENIKITRPIDLIVAQYVLNKRG